MILFRVLPLSALQSAYKDRELNKGQSQLYQASIKCSLKTLL